MLLAAAAGFVALGYEMVWARLYNFTTGSRGEAFAAMLGAYLVGLAGGSLLSRCWQIRSGSPDPSRAFLPARLLAGAGLLSFLVLPAVAMWISKSESAATRPLVTLPLVALAAMVLGAMLPLLCHQSIATDQRAGQRVGWLYLTNIAGSGLGSLLTGFYFLDRFGTAGTNMLLLASSVVPAVMLATFRRRAAPVDWAGFVFIVFVLNSAPHWQGRTMLKLFYGPAYTPASRVEQIVETRHGVIIVDTNGAVFGNKVYDGTIDTRLRPGSGLVRPYAISALHPAPRRVLVIGVSGGAWTQILADNPEVEKVTAVEINHGYLAVIRAHPEVSGILTNAKVELVIDDGRRWLRRHPGRRFDAIFMNTTFHWREFASALLSKEYLELVRDHLQPGGMVMWNCTGSGRALRTGMEVFPHTIMVINNCVGGLEPLVFDHARWRASLLRHKRHGQPLFRLPEDSLQLEEVLGFSFRPSHGHDASQWRMRDRADMQRRYDNYQIITDDNLGDEYHSVRDH